MTDKEILKEYRKSLRKMTDSLYHKQLESIKLESMSTTDLVDILRERDNRIEELEKENLENESEAREINIRFDKLLKKYMLQRSQLLKSKEIIKKLLHTLKNKDSDYTYALKNTHQVLQEAEQFLKEADE